MPGTVDRVNLRFSLNNVLLGILPFRKRFIRAPIVEFSGSRFRGLTVHDLGHDKTYDLTRFPGSRKIIDIAERHGYAVVMRPRPQEF